MNQQSGSSNLPWKKRMKPQYIHGISLSVLVLFKYHRFDLEINIFEISMQYSSGMAKQDCFINLPQVALDQCWIHAGV
ncbi:unnamed protein product [Acanthoscelides obtectus]|uniref:Uncharacterized protein n=1 Tax=Acanthoscelides obtectus TaxID=200917 RepID=A0A9P0KXQ2_ACAOB|nr:unnamed protein product [Acanthoscelides obtectus]CAK1678313.1 hypothetical protein AOBTE_LOCUS31817 [Acanthoscelides obtectus]